MTSNTPLNSHGNSYALPHDDREYSRLDVQHEANKVTFEGLYPQACRDKVLEVLDVSSGETRRILDLGSGSGAWCIDMALEFPYAEVLGIDLEPRQIRGPPSNCKFLRYNVDQGLSQYHGMYDLIHCRFAGHGFKDHTAVIVEIKRCLKPGGLVIYINSGGELDENCSAAFKAATSANPQWGWHQRMFLMVILGTTKLGNDLPQADIDVRKGFWGLEGFDQNNCGGIEVRVPLGTWATSEDPVEDARLKRMGHLWYEALTTLHVHLDKPLRASGRSDKDIKIMRTKIEEDLEEMKHNRGHRMIFRIRVIWGQTIRPAGDPGFTKHPIAEEDIAQDSRTSQNYPQGLQVLKVYHDKDEWKARDEAIRASFTPEMLSMLTVEGYDMIEDPELVSVRNDQLR